MVDRSRILVEEDREDIDDIHWYIYPYHFRIVLREGGEKIPRTGGIMVIMWTIRWYEVVPEVEVDDVIE